MYTDSHGSRWYKGNLHTHTTASDGQMTPEDCIALYKSRGYDFLALTDHWHPSASSVGDGITLLGGCEYDFGGDVRSGVFHIVAIGMEADPAIVRSDSPQAAIDKIHLFGGLASLAHPCWSMNTAEQLMPLVGIDYTEIYNTTSNFPHNCRPYSGDVLDIMAARGMAWKLAATDDAHWYDGDECGSFVYVQADNATPAALLDALRAGRFYASQGPRMELSRDGDAIVVRCPAEDEIVRMTAFTDTPWEDHRSEVGENLTSATFTLFPRASFVRIELLSADGKQAWSQYILR